jgi:uncharacterized protein YndB with AHSA1/START domain
MTTNSITITGAPDATDGDYVATVPFDAAPDAVYDALTTTTALSKWWTTVTGSAEAGGELTFVFNAPLLVRVDRAERPSTVRWTAVNFDPMPDWNGTTICFDLAAGDAGGTTLDFRHVGLTPQAECFDQCRHGWNETLASLVGLVDGGTGDPYPRSSQRQAAR